MSALPEVTRFLREHPPFDAIDPAEVERVARTVEVESHRSGETIFSQGQEPIAHLRVIRSGSVELVHDGRVLDLLGEGEMFGHASMLSGLPTGFEARAAEDALCYRIDAALAEELLAAPAGLRYVARSLVEASARLGAGPRDPSAQPVRALIRGEPVICAPETPVREAAQRMTSGAATAAVIPLGDGSLGILTDRDLRTRVIGDGLSGDSPVRAAMSAPAYSCRPDSLAGEVLLEMLDRGVQHYPVVTGSGEVLGVVEDRDLVAGQTRSGFFLRQRVGRASSVEELVAAAAELRTGVIELHEAGIGAATVMARYAIVVDAMTRRLLELAVAEHGDPPAEFAWLALGSQARREAAPSSDVDSAIVWFGEAPEDEVRPALLGITERVTAGLAACGLRSDEHGANAANALFVRSLASWQRAARSWIDDPTQEKALVLASVLVDSRPVWGIHTGTPVSDAFRPAPQHPGMLRLMARFALSHRPPTGFLRGLVVEHTGEHRGRLDLKHGGILPIVDLARWAGLAAGVASASTRERLRAAAEHGTLPAAEAHTLEDAVGLLYELRLGHQVEQLRAGQPPDDYLDPRTLSALNRSHLRGVFRAIASIQKRVAAELNVSTP